MTKVRSFKDSKRFSEAVFQEKESLKNDRRSFSEKVKVLDRMMESGSTPFKFAK